MSIARLIHACQLILTFALAVFPLPVSSLAQNATTVLLISVDGLKPEAVLQAQQHGLKVPNLIQLSHDGVYSSGVRGVLPTVTYPSHTTLLTGVSPAKHGIVANTTFDPLNKNAQGWYWYAEDIKVPTLWDAAHAAGMTTASVYWPVSVGAKIDYNLPQIWRSGTADDLKLQRALSTAGLEPELVAALGRYPGGMEETVDADEVRTNFAIRIIETKHPAFMTVYLTGLDTEQHKSGPFSAGSNAVLERLDALVGKLRAEAEKNSPGHAYVCVVSDHGFASVQHDVNLYGAFREAGFFTADSNRNISAWQAMPWPAGGAAAIMLADQKDKQTLQKVADLLQRLAADPANGIDRILTHEELVRGGGFPEAAFFVSFKIGYELGYSFDAPLISAPANGGMHGYLPENPEMRSSFFLVGPLVAQGQSLGEIDMRAIAPTLANLLHIQLPAAEASALEISPGGVRNKK
jgi:predicted AlkP superfamily pyrophosphatase or phosphodiesterase